MDFAGRKVKLTLQDGTIVDGFVHSLSKQNGQLSLEKVETTDNGVKKKLAGLQHYYGDEIENIVALDDVSKNKGKLNIDDDKCKASRGKSILGKKLTPAHLTRLRHLEPSALVLKNRNVDNFGSSGNEDMNSDTEQLMGGAVQQTDEYTIISKISPLFYEAVKEICRYKIISVGVEGVSIGRAGQLSWLTIFNGHHVFLFDMLHMGAMAFTEGLKSILEHKDILKVIHDCRMLSDMLHHQFEINLLNVFDTQVANVFVYRLKHHHDWPRYTEGLAPCLVQHLDLSNEDVNWAVVRQHMKQSDEEVWLQRPIQCHLVDAAMKNVKHLLELREVLMEKMMMEYVAGVNIYLMHVRDSNDADAKRYQTTSHLLPVAFTEIRQFMQCYTRRRKQSAGVNKDMHGFQENCPGIIQPDVIFSRDSLWHKGHLLSNKAKSASSDVDGSGDNNKPKPQKSQSTTSTPSPSKVKAQPINQQTITEPSSFNLAVRSPVKQNIPADRSIQSPEDPVAKPVIPASCKPRVQPQVQQPSINSVSQDDYRQPISEALPVEGAVKTRKNLLQHNEGDFINQTVQAINAIGISNLENASIREAIDSSSKPAVVSPVKVTLPSQKIEPQDREELKGGGLMRALVYEQDPMGYEQNPEVETFTFTPAGRTLTSKVRSSGRRTMKTSPVSPPVREDSVTNQQHLPPAYVVHSPTSEYTPSRISAGSRGRVKTAVGSAPDLAHTMPAAPVVAYPPQRTQLSAQEKMLVEQARRSSPTKRYNNTEEEDVLQTFLRNGVMTSPELSGFTDSEAEQLSRSIGHESSREKELVRQKFSRNDAIFKERNLEERSFGGDSASIMVADARRPSKSPLQRDAGRLKAWFTQNSKVT